MAILIEPDMLGNKTMIYISYKPYEVWLWKWFKIRIIKSRYVWLYKRLVISFLYCEKFRYAH
jgi:hypothetical protein